MKLTIWRNDNDERSREKNVGSACSPPTNAWTEEDVCELKGGVEVPEGWMAWAGHLMGGVWTGGRRSRGEGRKGEVELIQLPYPFGQSFPLLDVTLPLHRHPPNIPDPFPTSWEQRRSGGGASTA